MLIAPLYLIRVRWTVFPTITIFLIAVFRLVSAYQHLAVNNSPSVSGSRYRVLVRGGNIALLNCYSSPLSDISFIVAFHLPKHFLACDFAVQGVSAALSLLHKTHLVAIF